MDSFVLKEELECVALEKNIPLSRQGDLIGS